MRKLTCVCSSFYRATSLTYPMLYKFKSQCCQYVNIMHTFDSYIMCRSQWTLFHFYSCKRVVNNYTWGIEKSPHGNFIAAPFEGCECLSGEPTIFRISPCAWSQYFFSPRITLENITKNLHTPLKASIFHYPPWPKHCSHTHCLNPNYNCWQLHNTQHWSMLSFT